ncbi:MULTISPECIES: hypothetical protein [Streptomyces]|uniref:hypothetical protein n=1 Tax=Streptomyces TaxID=1883 RepID=UPI0004BEDE16|nr:MULTISPECIES: hypothetical protein [Streptomyces]MDX3275262.1 hypothetical protein [Streptomyces scabiei]MDX3846972.1 hypothetical protein [Streptomyces europaeiscabiei]
MPHSSASIPRPRHLTVLAVGVATALTLTACGAHSDTGATREKSASTTSAGKEKTTFKLGEASPVQESQMQRSRGATYTVTPTKVVVGSKADMDNSGLEQDKEDGPQVPVYVWSTLTHKSGKPMALGDMDDDLVVRTDTGQRTRALIVLLGQAQWPNCPAFDSDKKLVAGQSQRICTAFLIPQGQKAAAVQLSQGFYSKPLEWPVKS